MYCFSYRREAGAGQGEITFWEKFCRLAGIIARMTLSLSARRPITRFLMRSLMRPTSAAVNGGIMGRGADSIPNR